MRRNFADRLDSQVDGNCEIVPAEDSAEVYNFDEYYGLLLDCLVFTQKGEVLKEKEYLSIKESSYRLQMEAHLRGQLICQILKLVDEVGTKIYSQDFLLKN